MIDSSQSTGDTYQESAILQREAAGDPDVWEAIVERERALDTLIENRDKVIDSKDLVNQFISASIKVREIKHNKGIDDPQYRLETDE